MKRRRPVDRERSFGLVVGTVLILLAAYLSVRDGGAVTGRVGAVALVGALLVLLGRFRPRLLAWPSAVWWKVAAMLGWVNARIILTLIFLVLLVPLGLLWRVIGRDPLGRKRERWPGWSPYPARYRDRLHYTRMF